MNKSIESLGNAVAIAGVALCVVAGIARVAGVYHLGGYQVMTLFTGGMGLMLMGTLGKLHALGQKG